MSLLHRSDHELEVRVPADEAPVETEPVAVTRA